MSDAADWLPLPGRLDSDRGRALFALAVFAVVAWTGDTSRPLLVVLALLSALGVAVLIAPDLRSRWTFNLLVGVGIVLYGLAFAVGARGPIALALAAGMVLLGLLTLANYLGVAPWSEHPRRI